MEPILDVRMDKWLWAVRLYKTRSLAAKACLLGRVHANGQRAKPARSVRVGDVIAALTGEITRTVRVLALLDRRIGAPQIAEFLEDLTPAEEFEKRRLARLAPLPLKPLPKRRRSLGDKSGPLKRR